MPKKKPEPEERATLTVAQVAELNGVSKWTVYDWIYRKKVPVYYTGGGKGRPRFKPSEVTPKAREVGNGS
jgi:excisionase family DNA binding protein